MVIHQREKVDWAGRIGRRLKLRDLHILMSVVQLGSMVRAAERLAISQPVISKVVADLEHVLGVRLLDRGRHGVELTVYGEALVKRGLAAFDELRLGVKDIEFLLDAAAGEIKIAAADPIASGLIPAIIDRLCLDYPRLTYHVSGGASLLEQHCNALRAREVDLIVGRLPQLITEPDLDVEVLCEEPILIAAGTQSNWVKRRRIRLADLVDEHWVLPSAGSFAGLFIADLFLKSGLEIPKRAVYGTSIQMFNSLLATGRYLAFYPGSVLRFNGERMSVKVLNVSLPVPSTPLGIITLKGRTLSSASGLFVECARKVASP
jgi:DNA-binding transcriptional LysR family regulator